VWIRPATTTKPVRGSSDWFCAKRYRIVAEPVPLVGDSNVIHETVDEAVHEQVEPVVSCTVAVPELSLTLRLVGDRL
jgi:hypothetical protein